MAWELEKKTEQGKKWADYMPFSGSSLTVQDTYSKKSTIVMDVSR